MADPKRHPRVRESRPQWPHRGERPDEAEERPSRPPEIWEVPHTVENYTGSLTLEDWALTEDDELGSLRVLARYAVMRVLLLSTDGRLHGKKLRVERRIATEHLMLLPTQDWERMALQRLTDACREPGLPHLLDAVNTAGEAAAKRGHVMGAFSLFRTAYALGVERQNWADAARGARGIFVLARNDEAQYSARLWERRAVVLEKRTARLRRAAEAAGALPAEVVELPPAEWSPDA